MGIEYRGNDREKQYRRDFADFQVCFQDPDAVEPPAPECWFFDFQRDGAVDLADYAEFYLRFSGPSPAPRAD